MSRNNDTESKSLTEQTSADESADTASPETATSEIVSPKVEVLENKSDRDTQSGEETAAVDEQAGNSQSGPDPVSKKKAGGFFRGLTVTAVWLLLIGVLVAGGYYLWPQIKDYPRRIDVLEQNDAEVERQLTALGRELQQTSRQLQQQLEEYRQNLSAAEQDNRQLREQLQEQQRQIRTIAATTSDDWKLAEAYYLSRMATQRLVMERHAAGALALLQAADEIVRDRADPQLHQVRAQLAADIVALKLYTDVDREGVFLQLSALSQRLAQLPPAQLQSYAELQADNPADARSTDANVQATDADTPASEGIVARVKNSLLAALDDMQGFIRVSHHDQPLPAPPSLQQQRWLLFNLQTLLQSAQLALLRDQYQIYQSSLQQAQQLLEAHYSQAGGSAAIADSLAQLQQLNFNRSLPDISHSEQLLGEYLDRRHRVGSDANAGEAGADESDNPEQNGEAAEPSL